MTDLRKQFNLDIEKIIIKADRKERRKLNKQRKKIIAEIERVERKVKGVKFKDSEYSIKVELIDKMKVYVEKYAFLPRSYCNMLIQWSN